MIRENGFYWVKHINCPWEVMRWNGYYWQDSYGSVYDLPSRLTINEERIKTPDEQ